MSHERDGTTQDKVINLRSEINWYFRKLTEEQLRGSEASRKAMADLQDAIHKRENQVLRLLREMPASEALSTGLSSPKPATLAEIRRSEERRVGKECRSR